MAIDTYSALKTAIGTWLARSGDSSITGNAGDFIALLEARLNRWQPPLRVAEVDTTLTGTPGSRSLTLPSDFREPIALFRTTGGIYEPMRPFIAGSGPLAVESGTPQAWAINGATIDLDCPEAQADTFTLRYRQKFALSDDTPTNWLLTEHPDAYLFGSLVEALAFMKTADQASSWNGRFTAAMEEIADQDHRSKAIAPATVDDALVTPRPYSITRGY